MSTDLPPLTDMKPRLVTTLLGNPGGRVMQSFVRAPWSGDYYEATVDSVVSGQASNLRISRCGADGTMLDYAVLEGAGHGAAITAEYDSGQVWIWLFWGSDVGHPTGTAVRWAYNGTPNGARVLLADAETVPDPGAGDPGHINGYFAIDQAKDRIATKFSSGTTETYTLWKLSDYKAGTGSPLFTVPTTWPTGDLSAFQGFTTSDKSLYITRGGSQPSDQAPTLYELDWATGVITNTLDISQLAATTSAGPDGGHNEAEGVCLWRDSGGNPELLFGIDTGPTSNRRGLVFRLAAPVDGTKTKTVNIDAERVIDGPATNVVAAFSYDRTVRYTTGGFTPTGYADPVKLSEQSTAVLSVSDHPDLTDDSYGFVIHAKLSWDDAADPGRRKIATYTAQLSAADPAVVNLSQALVATGAVAPGQVIAGAPGHSPVVTMVGDQVAVDGVVQGAHLTADATAAQQAAAQSAQAAAASAALVGAPAGTAIDAHLGGDSTGLVGSDGKVTPEKLLPPTVARHPLTGWYHANAGTGTVTRAAIQAAIDAAGQSQAKTGQGGTVYIPDPPAGSSWTMDGTINLRSRVTIRGNNRVKTAVLSGSSIDQTASFPTLVGPGSVPLFQIGAGYPTGMDSLAATDVVIDGISARNAEAPVLRNWAGLNFRIVNCDLRSSYAATGANNRTIELRYAYRGVIEQSAIGCVRGWCIDARDNINGVAIRDNIISGGSLGGAIQVGLAASITIQNNVIEGSADGITIAPGGPGPSSTEPNPSGICNSITITGNYIEDAARYITIGAGFECRGGVIKDNYLGGGLTRANIPQYGILAGRLTGFEIKGNSWYSVAGEPFLKVSYTTGGTVTAPARCEIGPNAMNAVAGAITQYDTSAYPNAVALSSFVGSNTVWVGTSVGTTARVSGNQSWTSGTINAASGTAILALQMPDQSPWGASMIALDVIAATGTIGSTIQLGTTISMTEIASQDPSALTLTNGAASVDLTAKNVRSGYPLLLRVVAGSGTGSYQVRVRWRGL